MRGAGGPIGGLLAGTLASAALAGVLAHHVRTVLSDHVGPWQVDAVIEVAVTAAGALVAVWLAAGALLATVCVVVRVAGASWRAGERLVHRCAPQVVRKALVLAVGAGIGLGMATGASAVVPVPSPSSATVEPHDAAVPDDLGWAVTTTSTSTPDPDLAPRPTTVTEPSASASAAPAPAEPVPAPARPAPGPTAPPGHATAAVETAAADHVRTPPAPVGSGEVVVEAGDSLWAIAARHLPSGATDAQIAAAWPQWYQANVAVIGADPDLLRPGQVLLVPATAGEPAL
ncbi:LysM peptidoglycan-binding domain-containing protein [Cellulomonas terrae]|nr:LysM domain-containing protein [Cellulomonas terrae]